jgi:hypothetical protein
MKHIKLAIVISLSLLGLAIQTETQVITPITLVPSAMLMEM